MSFLYGLTDIKFRIVDLKNSQRSRLKPYKFRRIPLLAIHDYYNHDDLSIDFRVTPAPLLELCISAVDKLPLTAVFEWSDKDIRLWIFRYGYPQYMNTFRVNMITGRKLLFVDANALSAMNIKNFAHIKHITYGIRMLFHFQLVKFSSSISLPGYAPHDLYKLWHTQTGLNYDKYRCTDVLQRMGVIRERCKNLCHWELLELWVNRERKLKELFGLGMRGKLYNCPKPHQSLVSIPSSDFAYYESPFEIMGDPLLKPSRASVKSPKYMNISAVTAFKRPCLECIPPCECDWPPRYYLTGTVVNCLKRNFPQKFAPVYKLDDTLQVEENVKMRWTRFSI